MRLNITEWLISGLLVLNLVDFVATFYAIEYLSATELNPILLKLIESTETVWSILWFKIAVLWPLTLYWLNDDVKKYLDQEFVIFILGFVALFYTIINTYSLFNIIRTTIF